METREIGTGANGTRRFEIQTNALSYRALLRSIKRVSGAKIVKTSHDPMNDDTLVSVKYKGATITIATPFSDYIVSCTSSDEIFDEFMDRLKRYKVKWWEHYF